MSAADAPGRGEAIGPVEPAPGPGGTRTPLIRVRDVSFTYPGEVHAICGVELDVAAGETVAIIGQNGAGKSTLAKLLNGLLRPGAGSVQIDGVDTTSRTAARTARMVGYVFQNPDDQIFHSTVEAELRYGLRRLDLDPEELEARVGAAADLCGLSGALDVNPYDLPYSVRKFVTIALVLALQPQVLVLDEPTAGQDLAGLERIARIISHAAGAGQAVITITHDMEFVAANADRVVVMAQGQVIRDAAAARIFADADAMTQARLEAPAIADVIKALGATDLRLNPPDLARWIRARH